jgi:hypothetical protein
MRVNTTCRKCHLMQGRRVYTAVACSGVVGYAAGGEIDGMGMVGHVDVGTAGVIGTSGEWGLSQPDGH